MIKHSVFFKLKVKGNALSEADFLSEAMKLATIPKVNNYEIVKEVSPKNEFQYGLYMEFDSEADYQFYCEHELHVNFVENIWIPNVEQFQEIDYVSLEVV